VETDHSLIISAAARRGLRWQLIGLMTWVALTLISLVGSIANPLMAILVVMSGIGIVTIGRGLRASGALIRVTRPPQPRWIDWLVPVTFVLGPLIVAIGLWLLLDIARAVS